MLTKAQTTTTHQNPQKPPQPTPLLHQTYHLQQRQLNDDAFRALQEKMWLLRCSENRQGKNGEAVNVPHWRCSPDTALAVCSNRQQLQIYLNCSMQNKPNFKNTKINTKPAKKSFYKISCLLEDRKNKANSNPIKAIQTQFTSSLYCPIHPNQMQFKAKISKKPEFRSNIPNQLTLFTDIFDFYKFLFFAIIISSFFANVLKVTTYEQH